MAHPQSNDHLFAHRILRRGFSFTEILFAVMILGIGFIMVAAMFPVAIRQTQGVQEDTMAGTVGREAATYMGRLGTLTLHPPDPVMYPPGTSPFNITYFPPTNSVMCSYQYTGAAVALPASTLPQVQVPFWSAVSGNLILPSDSRYAFVPFYGRAVDNSISGAPAAATYAQVTIIVVQCRNSGGFTSADIQVPPGTPPQVPNLQGRPMYASISWKASPTPDQVIFSPSAPGLTTLPDYTSCVAEGSYVVIADDYQQASPSYRGYLFRVGNAWRQGSGALTTNTWELMPGNDTKVMTSQGNGPPAGGTHGGWMLVYVVGRGYANPAVGGAFAGPAMDVGAFVTYVRCK